MPTADLEGSLADSDADAYDAWLAGDDGRAERIERYADRLRDELARRQGLEVAYQERVA